MCEESGHHGRKCTYLWGYYGWTTSGQKHLEEQEYTIPDEAKEVSETQGKTLEKILQKNWPIDKAILFASKILRGQCTQEDIETFGDYPDKRRMALAIGNPNGWEYLPWTTVYNRFLQVQDFQEKQKTTTGTHGSNIDFAKILREVDPNNPLGTPGLSSSSSTSGPQGPQGPQAAQALAPVVSGTIDSTSTQVSEKLVIEGPTKADA